MYRLFVIVVKSDNLYVRPKPVHYSHNTKKHKKLVVTAKLPKNETEIKALLVKFTK